MNSTLFLIAQKIDVNVIHWVSGVRSTFGIKAAIFIGEIGNPLSFLLLTIVMVLIFWLHKKPHHLIQFIVTLSTGSLVVYLIKIYVAKARPAEALISAGGYSFPSGHATIATLFCLLIIFSYKSHFKNSFLKTIFIGFFVLVALVISFSRVYLSVHYLSDVIVGILLGLLISSISVFIFESLFKKEELM